MHEGNLAGQLKLVFLLHDGRFKRVDPAHELFLHALVLPRHVGRDGERRLLLILLAISITPSVCQC